MGRVYIKIFLFSFHNHFNLIASHTNSHSNTNTGLIANSNNNNAIRGLMNNIIINNNNNIIICFSLIVQSSRGSNPAQSRPVLPPITLTAVLYSCTKLSTSSMDYTPLTQQRESHPHLLFSELQYYYTMLCYYMLSAFYDVLTYNKIKENTNSRNRTHVYRFGICSITTILCSQYAKGCQLATLI